MSSAQHCGDSWHQTHELHGRFELRGLAACSLQRWQHSAAVATLCEAPHTTAYPPGSLCGSSPHCAGVLTAGQSAPQLALVSGGSHLPSPQRLVLTLELDCGDVDEVACPSSCATASSNCSCTCDFGGMLLLSRGRKAHIAAPSSASPAAAFQQPTPLRCAGRAAALWRSRGCIASRNYHGNKGVENHL